MQLFQLANRLQIPSQFGFKQLHCRLLSCVSTGGLNSFETTQKYRKLTTHPLSDLNSGSSGLFNRHISTLKPVTNDVSSITKKSNEKTWTPIYRLPAIVGIRLLSRLKLYQTGLLVLVTPVSIMASIQGNVDSNTPFLVLSLTSFALVVLAAMSVYFRRIIGIVSLNSDRTRVRLSHLTFWGNRKEVICDMDNVVAPSDIGDNARKNFLIKVPFYDRKEYLYLCIRYGRILDEEAFYHTFGPVR